MSILASILVPCILGQASEVPTDARQAKPLQVGATVPLVKVTTSAGTLVNLGDVTKGKRTVLIFYRGGWCPFCNAHLAELGQIADAVKAKGAQIIGISPDNVAELVKSIDKHHLTYTLLSDSKAEAMRKFGVAFRVDDATFSMYKERFNLDLEKASGEKHHYLPVPSVFVIDSRGKITYAYSNPDYKVRLKGQDILKALD